MKAWMQHVHAVHLQAVKLAAVILHGGQLFPQVCIALLELAPHRTEPGLVQEHLLIDNAGFASCRAQPSSPGAIGTRMCPRIGQCAANMC
jgi:hypothetical protein